MRGAGSLGPDCLLTSDGPTHLLPTRTDVLFTESPVTLTLTLGGTVTPRPTFELTATHGPAELPLAGDLGFPCTQKLGRDLVLVLVLHSGLPALTACFPLSVYEVVLK